jgi:phosphatidylserine/phosphatidylglycerophosphate/cardiolipin synthase-like enzyme
MSRRAASSGLPRWVWLVLFLLLVVALVGYVLLNRGQPQALPGPRPEPAESPDDWEVAFTTPRIPDDPNAHRGGLDERLVALMDRADQTLDVAIYDFDLQNVAQAMARAAGRGARVRMVTDSDTLGNTRDQKIQAAFRTVQEAGIPIVADNREPLMHHKFTVVDGEWVQTGSWNYTDGDTYRLNNNLAIVRSRELAENYTAEFEKMFVQRRFGPNKVAGVPNPSVSVASLRIENHFAPEDDVSKQIIEEISRAERKISFLAFSFTHDEIGQAMLQRAQAGVQVRGVFETTGSNTQFSEFGRLRQAGLEVYQDGSPYVMHHKVIVIDERTTIFGSYNFSANADTDNDENLLIVQDPRFAALYEQETDRMVALARNPPARR